MQGCGIGGDGGDGWLRARGGERQRPEASNEKRLVILCFLATRGEMPVGALTEALNLSQSALAGGL
jgi:DNA-binding transcriptional ArsR family regulator